MSRFALRWFGLVKNIAARFSALTGSFLKSVRGQIVLMFLALSLTPLIVTGAIIFFQSQKTIRADIEQEFSATGDLQAMEINTWLAEREKDILTLAGIARIQSMEAANACPAVMQYFRQWKLYQNIFVARPDGSRLCDALGSQASLADRVYFKDALAGQMLISDTLASKTDSLPILVIAAPIYVDEEIVGVIGMTVSTEYMSNLLQTTQRGQTRETYLVGWDGFLITASRFDAELLARGVIQKKSAMELHINTTGWQRGLDGQSGLAEYTGYNGRPVLGVYRPIPSLGAGAVLLLEQELTEVREISNRLSDSILVVAVFSSLGVIGLAVVFGRMLTRPLVVIARRVNTLAQGNLEREDAHLELRQIDQRQDEYGLISRAVKNVKEYLVSVADTASQIAGGNLTVQVAAASREDETAQALGQMIAGLRGLIGSVKENAANLEAASSTLATTSAQAGEATNQIAITIQQVPRPAPRAHPRLPERPGMAHRPSPIRSRACNRSRLGWGCLPKKYRRWANGLTRSVQLSKPSMTSLRRPICWP